jgi:hypothetical protein
MNEHTPSDTGRGDEVRKAELDPDTLELEWHSTDGGTQDTESLGGIGWYTLIPISDSVDEEVSLWWHAWGVDTPFNLDARTSTNRAKHLARDHARRKLRGLIDRARAPTGKLPTPGEGLDPDSFELTWNRTEDGSRRTNIVPGVGQYVLEPVTGTIEGFRLVWYPWEGLTAAALNDREDLAIAMERAKRHARTHIRQINAWATTQTPADVMALLKSKGLVTEDPRPPMSPPPKVEDCQDERAEELAWAQDGSVLRSGWVPGVGTYTIGALRPNGRGPTAYDPVLRSLAWHPTPGESELLADRVSEKTAKKLAALHVVAELSRTATNESLRRLRDAAKGFAPDAFTYPGSVFGPALLALLEQGKAAEPREVLLEMDWRPRGGDPQQGFESRKVQDAGIYCVIPSGDKWALYLDPGNADTIRVVDRMPSPEAAQGYALADVVSRVAKVKRNRDADFDRRARVLEKAAHTARAQAEAAGIDLPPDAELARRALAAVRAQTEHPTLQAIRLFRRAMTKEGERVQTETVLSWLDMLIASLETYETFRRAGGIGS